MKEVLFPKLLAVSEQCREHGGVGGIPVWSKPSLGSPRDPWVLSDAPLRTREKSDTGFSNNHSSLSQNPLLDSVEIKDDTTGTGDSQGKSEPSSNAEPMEVDTPDPHKKSAVRVKPSSSSMPLLDDRSSQGEHPEQQLEEDVPEKDVTETEQEGQSRGAMSYQEMRDDASEQPRLRQTANEIRDVLQVTLRPKQGSKIV